MNIYRRLFLLPVAIAGILVAFPAMSQDLSGTWSLQRVHRTIFAGNTLQIEQTGSEINIKRWRLIPEESLAWDISCTIGGDSCTVVHDYEEAMGNPLISNRQWKAYLEEGAVVIDLTYDMRNDGKRSRKYIFNLADETTLTVGYIQTYIGSAKSYVMDGRTGTLSETFKKM